MDIEAKGMNGIATFDGTYVSIRRTGMARMTIGKGEKRLPVASITAVQWKPAGALVNGFIQFTVPGGAERRSKFGSQTMDAVKDENSVVFSSRQQAQFESLRQAIEAAIARHHGHAAPSAASAGEELSQVAALFQQGLLTQQEFETAKARILGAG